LRLQLSETWVTSRAGEDLRIGWHSDELEESRMGTKPQPQSTNTRNYSAEEWATRKELANCYHLVDHMGWSETIFNHISARVPGSDKHYLVNPFGLLYPEVTPENLLKVDIEGNKVEFSQYEANPAGFALHGAIHGARDDMHCVIHTHTTAVAAIAQKDSGFSHNDFYGAQLFGRIGYHDFEGITLFADEKERMLKSLSDKHVLVLRNHGIAVGESSIAKAFFLLWTVQRSAEIQCQADGISGSENVLADEVRQKSRDLADGLVSKSALASMFYDSMVRKMHAERH
jgi:ribulose-5-phosphate 4-epimerase/fuculose-1-phosphate aldolase